MITTIALLCILILSFIYAKGNYNEDYWRKRGVVFYTKNRAFGPIFQFITTKRAYFEIIHDIYTKYSNEPAVGLGGILKPSLLLRDPANIQDVMEKNFSSFYHRGPEINEGDLLGDGLIFMNGVRWKLTRHAISPLFKTTNLKNMYYILNKGAQDFVDYVKKHPDSRNGNAYNTITSFCNAAIGAAVFGIHTESIFDSPYIKMLHKVIEPTSWSTIKYSISNVNPKLGHTFKLTPFSPHQAFFIAEFKKLLRQREIENLIHHDFTDLCLKIKKKGTIHDEKSGYKLEPTDELLAAQGFFFFVAGVDPCSTALFSTLVELGKNLKILEKVHTEIDESFEKCNGEISYDVLADMDYLDCVLDEAMRKHPPAGLIGRRCMKDSVLPAGKIPVSAGTKVIIPAYSIHNDEKYFPNPEVFNPDRFKDGKKNVCYMPFGKGKRKCFGYKYAKLQVKAGLVHFLRHFTVETFDLENVPKYAKQPVQVRMTNVDCRFIPRNYS